MHVLVLLVLCCQLLVFCDPEEVVFSQLGIENFLKLFELLFCILRWLIEAVPALWALQELKSLYAKVLAEPWHFPDEIDQILIVEHVLGHQLVAPANIIINLELRHKPLILLEKIYQRVLEFR